ncbi:jg16768 [Pararge aegeria aegeria]|uniref:Jg16768 protein n=1 Tax=Pararge aegeria aegeria TaxID=348720 RepID=A0A8S4RDH0_9NEOP|nr:jg16768 [Pararge aegeria aegeria]
MRRSVEEPESPINAVLVDPEELNGRHPASRREPLNPSKRPMYISGRPLVDIMLMKLKTLITLKILSELGPPENKPKP